MMENKNQRFFKFDYIKPSFIFIYKNMAVRTALLTSRNITLDTDFSKYIESITTPGMIKGKEFTVTASSVSAGTAFVPCTRTNGETIYALVQNFSPVSISGNGYVIIKVDDSIVDNGGGNEDGTGIATIEVVASLPSKNYLHLATITNGTVTMVAPTIKKLNELDTEIQSIFSQLADLDQRVENLEEADAIDHLEESGLVGELYTLNDTLFKQYAPTLANSTLEANVGDVAANTEIHVQAMGSGVASNQLKLKVKMAGAPTTSLKVEVRKGIQVTVTENVEAYWYGDSNNIYATGTLASSSFSSDWAEVTFNLDNEVGGTKGELLDVVVYQTTGSGATVNASNYYVLACDSTQYSEAFSYVSVNGSTRARSKLMPYLSSDGFVQAMLSKVKNGENELLYTWSTSQTTYNQTIEIATVTMPSTGKISIVGSCGATTSGKNVLLNLKVNGTAIGAKSINIPNSTYAYDFNVKWDDFIPGGSEVKVLLGAAGTYSSTLNSGAKMYYEKYQITQTQIKAFTNTVKPIGSFITATIYGIDNNGVYRGGIINGTNTEAITGSIAPGNFVGYLEVNYNGSIVKVPYYN